MSNLSVSCIKIKDVTKIYNSENTVIPLCNVEIPAGEFTVILGPSGCGKSTLLRMIAGLESVTSGTIEIGGQEIQNKEPKDRGCAMVFQNYALYPHMTVAKNIGYSLKVMGLSKKDINDKVSKVAASMGLTEYLDRLPHQLSGGQRQRVAIGRAISREPKVLLFDEPLSNLDAQLRNDMRIELADLHKRISATSIFVTHDQVEAMTLADKILILNKGNVEQFATPGEIYHRPATIFVAEFIGSPAMNIIEAEIINNEVFFDGKSLGILPCECNSSKVRLGIRPEEIIIDCNSDIEVKIEHKEDLGSHNILHGYVNNIFKFRIVTPFGQKLTHQDIINIKIPLNKCHFFDLDSQKNMNIYSQE